MEREEISELTRLKVSGLGCKHFPISDPLAAAVCIFAEQLLEQRFEGGIHPWGCNSRVICGLNTGLDVWTGLYTDVAF